MSKRPTSRMPLFLLILAVITIALVSLDYLSRTRRPTSDAEAIIYALWQTIRYPGDQTDHFTPRD